MQPPSIQNSSTQILDINTITGLSEQEAAARLAKEGHNELPSTGRRGVVKIVLEIVREPMFILLIAGLVLVLYVPLLRDLFSFATPNPLELLLCVAAALISILWFEIIKLVRNWRK